MTQIISMNSVKNSVKNLSLAAATTAMCINLGLSAQDSEAAKAALSDIAHDEGTNSAKAIIISMDDPFGPFYA